MEVSIQQIRRNGLRLMDFVTEYAVVFETPRACPSFLVDIRPSS